MREFLDTDVLIRHLTGDPPGVAARATQALAGDRSRRHHRPARAVSSFHARDAHDSRPAWHPAIIQAETATACASLGGCADLVVALVAGFPGGEHVEECAEGDVASRGDRNR